MGKPMKTVATERREPLPESGLMTEVVAAKYLGVSVQTLQKDRSFKPTMKVPFLRLGSKILYRKNDIDLFLSKLVVNMPSATEQPVVEPLAKRLVGRPRKQVLQPEIAS